MADKVERFIFDNNEYEVSIPDGNIFKDVRMLLLGNSHNRGTGGQSDVFTYTRSDGSTVTWGKGWGYYFKEYTGCDGEIICQSGGDFVDGDTTENAFYLGMNYEEVIAEYGASLTLAEREAFRYIVVGGGYNDHNQNYSNVVSHINSFCDECRSWFPKAQIWIIPIWGRKGMSDANERSVWNAISRTAAVNGCGTCSNTFSWFYGQATETDNDGIHLNDLGYQRCAKMMISTMLGWDGDRKLTVGAGFQSGEGVTYDGFRYYRSGDFTYFQGVINYTNKTISNLGTITAQAYIPYTTVYFPVFLFNGRYSDRRIITCCLHGSSTNVPGQLNLILLEDPSTTFPESGSIYFCHQVQWGT